MRLRNSRVLVLLAGLFLSTIGTQSQEANPPQPGAGNAAQPAGRRRSKQTPPPRRRTLRRSPPNSGVFVFKKQVDEVLLHATVVDNKQRMVMDLDRGAFSVYENDKPQPITSFRKEDVPVAMGIVIDNSGSMREKRDQVNKAALNLVRASNPAGPGLRGQFQ